MIIRRSKAVAERHLSKKDKEGKRDKKGMGSRAWGLGTCFPIPIPNSPFPFPLLPLLPSLSFLLLPASV